MEKATLRDPETGAYSADFLADCLEKECSKAGRFRRPLSLVFLFLGDGASSAEKLREEPPSGALSGMVDGMRKALRNSDLIARVSRDRFCVVLPETDHFGSLLTLRRLRKTVRGMGMLESATYPRDGKVFEELYRAGEKKYLRQKKSPLYRMHLMEKTFWDAFDILMGTPERVDKDLGKNRHFTLPRETYLRLVEAVAQDVSLQGNFRGLVIAAGPRPEIYKRIFLSFESDEPARRNVCVVGPAGGIRDGAKNLGCEIDPTEALKEKEVLLYLKEDGAYGIFAAGRQDEVCGFHTADEWLVEAMMEKMQEHYRLQGNF
ncbi:MAG: diguanylate cyclase [Deltaproteobacteria bacterium]|nr:diguanylate cyclase [Deltaproteobacteria bacterium]